MPITTVTELSADPAAGVLGSWTATEDVLINSLVLTFVTSAAVANRRLGLQAKDASNNVFWMQFTSADIAASSTINLCAFEGAPTYALQANVLTLSLPSGGMRLKKGDSISVLCNALDVGDNMGSLVMLAERPVY